METFKDRIIELFREAKKTNYELNQKDFAAKFGASRSQLKGWLSGAGAPSTNMLKIIAKECNVSVDWLIGNTITRTPVDEVIKKLNQFPDKQKRSPIKIIEADTGNEKIIKSKAANTLSYEESRFLKQYLLMEKQQKDVLQKFADIIIPSFKNE